MAVYSNAHGRLAPNDAIVNRQRVFHCWPNFHMHHGASY